MRIGTAIAIYFLIWWTVLFCILPIGVRSQSESGDVVAGSDPGAPNRPMLRKKAILTTLVSTLIFLVFWAVRASGVTLEAVLRASPF
jgi:predicted secreted protein